jgi:2,3-bisphosphoglycerate-independent phosphoglycerate mutase
MNEKIYKKTTILFSVPGFGLSTAWHANAISAAKTPIFDDLWKNYKHFVISSPYQMTKGRDLLSKALPYRMMDTGKPFVDNKVLIDKAIGHKLLDSNKMLKDIFDNISRHHSVLHLIGNISKNAEFGDIDHLLHIIKLARKNSITNVLVHVIADNTFENVHEFGNKLAHLQAALKTIGIGEIRSIVGQATVLAKGNSQILPKLYFENKSKKYLSLEQGLARQKDKKPAELSPFIITKNRSMISDFDSVILFNHTFDHLTSLLPYFLTSLPLFSFPKKPKFLQLISLFEFPTIYAEHLSSIFRRDSKKALSGKLNALKKKQLLICDSNDKAFLSYYFCGGDPDINIQTINQPGTLSANPSSVANRYLDALSSAIKSEIYDLISLDLCILVDSARSGEFEIAKDTTEVIDELLKKIVELQFKRNLDIIFISPFGQAEKIAVKSSDEEVLLDPTKSPVPLIYISEAHKQNSKSINSIVEEIASDKHDLTLVNQILCDSLGL